MPVLEIGCLASDQPPVVYEAATAERLSKDDFLFCSRIEAILVGPLHLCAHDLGASLLLLYVRSNGGQSLDFGFHIAILTLNWLHIKGLGPQGHQL